MSARKGKHSKDAKADRARYASRPLATRNPFAIITVFCDDTETAPAYFRALARTLKDKITLDVRPKQCNSGNPQAVVEDAVRAGEGRSELASEHYSVWVLLDLEGTPEQQEQAKQAGDKAQESGLKVAYSKPCFEVWTLLHLEDTGSLFETCGAVLDRVKKKWKDAFDREMGKKAQADYKKILDLRAEASKRARRHHENRDPSWTEIFLLSDAIDEAVRAAERPPTNPD